MTRFLVRRLFTSLIVILGVVTLVFGVLRAVPGDPVAYPPSSRRPRRRGVPVPVRRTRSRRGQRPGTLPSRPVRTWSRPARLAA